MKLEELAEQSRKNDERARELERRARTGREPADDEEAFLREVLARGDNAKIVRAIERTSSGEGSDDGRSTADERSVRRAPSRLLVARIARVAGPLALAAAAVLLLIGRRGGDRELPSYTLHAGGSDAPSRGDEAANGGVLSEGAHVVVTATPEHATSVPITSRAFARCDGSSWSPATGSLNVAPSGAVRFEAPREGVFGSARGACEIAIVVAREGEPLVAPGRGATTVLTARYHVR
jgi:hypothetical protein